MDSTDPNITPVYSQRTKVSVIIPSRLQENPASVTRRIYLGRACQNADDHQTADVDIECVVGLDPGMRGKLPGYFQGPIDEGRLVVVEAEEAGQAAAVNAAVRASTGSIIALCEDDDIWRPDKLACQLPLLGDFEMVTCVQREVDERGNFIRVNEFPTPSGWLMRRATWDRVGPMNETFRFHVDTEWLGRARVAGVKRVHLVPEGHVAGPWLNNVALFSKVAATNGTTEPLVTRTANMKGGMARIHAEPGARAQSEMEHRRMVEAFGSVPW